MTTLIDKVHDWRRRLTGVPMGSEGYQITIEMDAVLRAPRVASVGWRYRTSAVADWNYVTCSTPLSEEEIRYRKSMGWQVEFIYTQVPV